MIPFESLAHDLDAPGVCVGTDLLDLLPEHVPQGRLLLMTSAGFTRRGLTAEILNCLKGRDVEIYDHVTPNPELDDLDALATRMRDNAPNGILAVGGGSVLDSAKVLSLLIPSTLPRPLHSTLRTGNPTAWHQGIPLVAVPTTAGTGAEATPFATVWDGSTRQKYSLQDLRMLPHTALLVPELTRDLPLRETRHTGLDAISHALESLWNRNACDQSRVCAVEALERAAQALPTVLVEPDNVAARRMMQEASFLAGCSIRHTRTALAHAISYPLTLDYNIPHGLACSFTLSALLRHCAAARKSLAMPSDLEHSIAALLRELAPERELLNDVTPGQIRALLPRMFSPGRSDNFILPADAALVDQIVKASLDAANPDIPHAATCE